MSLKEKANAKRKAAQAEAKKNGDKMNNAMYVRFKESTQINHAVRLEDLLYWTADLPEGKTEEEFLKIMTQRINDTFKPHIEKYEKATQQAREKKRATEAEEAKIDANLDEDKEEKPTGKKGNKGRGKGKKAKEEPKEEETKEEETKEEETKQETKESKAKTSRDLKVFLELQQEYMQVSYDDETKTPKGLPMERRALGYDVPLVEKHSEIEKRKERDELKQNKKKTKEEKAKDDRATKDKKNLDPEEKARLEAEKEAEDKIKREKARLGAKKEGKVIFMMLGEDAEVVKHVVRDMVKHMPETQPDLYKKEKVPFTHHGVVAFPNVHLQTNLENLLKSSLKMDVEGVHYDEVILLKTLVGEEGWQVEPWTVIDTKGGIQPSATQRWLHIFLRDDARAGITPGRPRNGWSWALGSVDHKQVQKMMANKDWKGIRARPIFQRLEPKIAEQAQVMERYAEAEEDFGVDVPQLDTRLYIECGTLGGKYDFTNPGYILFLINGRRPEMTRGFTTGFNIIELNKAGSEVMSITSHDSKNGKRLSQQVEERLNGIIEANKEHWTLILVCADGQSRRLHSNAKRALRKFGAVSGQLAEMQDKLCGDATGGGISFAMLGWVNSKRRSARVATAPMGRLAKMEIGGMNPEEEKIGQFDPVKAHEDVHEESGENRKAVARMRALGGTNDAAVVVPGLEQTVTAEDVVNALNTITWPECYSRKNVTPEDAPVNAATGERYIEAFALGLVLNYCMGLCTSVNAKTRRNLTQVVCRYFNGEVPDFPYTTIQFNKNYASKMHVDGNNEGPSYICGFGDYTGGELWILDEKNGTVPMEVTSAMKGYPSLKVGQTVMGRLVDCKNKLISFSGLVPHCTMPYNLTRYTLVFFCRRKWDNMKDTVRTELTQAGLRLPQPGQQLEGARDDNDDDDAEVADEDDVVFEGEDEKCAEDDIASEDEEEDENMTEDNNKEQKQPEAAKKENEKKEQKQPEAAKKKEEKKENSSHKDADAPAAGSAKKKTKKEEKEENASQKDADAPEAGGPKKKARKRRASPASMSMS